MYRERWGYLYLELLRAEVWQGLEGRDASIRSRVAAQLAEPCLDSPFHAPARALAALRDVAADPAFMLRATMGAFVLPEVCDPDGANEQCRRMNASLFLPYAVESPGQISFDVEVTDRAGARCFAASVREHTAISDLRMARPVAVVPAEELADGEYQLVLRTLVDGSPPRPTDKVLRMPFHVLRGYQKRSEKALGIARDLAPQLHQLERALLAGVAAQVVRAYTGEAGEGLANPVEDLLRLEACLANLEHDRPVLSGLYGDVPTALPGSTQDMACVLRIAPTRNPSERPAARPLVVVAGGSPSYDTEGIRPTAPATRGPRWLSAALKQFGEDQPWDVAFFDSPGGGRRYGDDLREALAAVRTLWSVGDRPVVLVCEREAAAVVGLLNNNHELNLAGLVLIGAGAMPAATLEKLGSLPVRVAFLHGYKGSDALRRTLDFVEKARSESRWQGDFAALDDAAPAWVFGLPSYREAIEKFVRHVIGSSDAGQRNR